MGERLGWCAVKDAKVVAAPAELSTTGTLWASLVSLHARVGNEVEKVLQRRLGIGFSELLALLALSRSPDGELRMQELAELTSLNQSSVSRLVARLERSGLTERRMCEHDRRGVYTGITDIGRETLTEAVPVYEKALAEAFGQISVDAELGPLLARILPASAKNAVRAKS
jgi:DNA-binding MarR family transcriptional regulator